MKKSEMIGFKTTSEIKTALENIAESEDRSLSYIINRITKEYLEKTKKGNQDSMYTKNEVIDMLNSILDEINEAEKQRYTTRTEEREVIIRRIEEQKEKIENNS